MLLEFDVITSVCNKLKEKGYTIKQCLQTNQQGDDIIAIKEEDSRIELYIEAKGETSSREGSSRFGKPFDSAQVHVHVAEAFYKACEVLARNHNGVVVKAGVAFPNNDLHRTFVKKIHPIIYQLGIAIFWVEGNGQVAIDSNWMI
jgi:hypothetical protein